MFKNPKVLALVFLFPVILLAVDFYGGVGHCDNCLGSQVMHALGGSSMALLFLYLMESNGGYSGIRPRKFLVLISAVSFVALIGLLWEFWEFSMDNFFPGVLGGVSQLTLADTMADLFFDLAGAAVISLLYLIGIYFNSKLYKTESFNK